jgi:hypothetical protein
MHDFDEYSKPERRKDVWDYQWLFSRMNNKLYSVVSTRNLISNIGFGENANHTFSDTDKLSSLKRYSKPIKEIKIQKKFKVSYLFDYVIFERFYNRNPRSIIIRIALKLIKIFTAHH